MSPAPAMAITAFSERMIANQLSVETRYAVDALSLLFLLGTKE